MRVLIYVTLLLVATGAALIFGKREEKATAAVLLAGNLGSALIEHLFSSHAFLTLSLAYFSFDALLAVALCGLAVRWPTWLAILIAAWQVNGTLAHLVKMAVPETVAISYAVLLKFWAWPMVLVLLAARIRPALRSPLRAARWPHIWRAPTGSTIRRSRPRRYSTSSEASAR
jgi:hypothetical protein